MTTTAPDIARVLVEFIVHEFHVPVNDGDFGRDVHLFDAGYVDSLGLVRLIAFVESTFQLQLEQTQLFSSDFTTIHGMARLIAAACAVPSASPAALDGPVRPLRLEDLDPVVRLYERVMRSGTTDPPPRLRDYFERLFLANPHADPELPSLVYEDDGCIRGFIGVHARRFSLRGKPLRLACAGQFVVEPESRSRGAGAHLLHAFFALPHDLAITDGGTDEVLRMWEAAGGWSSPQGNLVWRRVLRPTAFLAANIETQLLARGVVRARQARVMSSLRVVARPATWAIDAMARALTPDSRRASPSSMPFELLSPAKFDECLRALAGSCDLVPDYDTEYLEWLWRELHAVPSRGALHAHLLRGDDGRVLGWYIYYLQRGGVSQTLQVAAARGHEQVVLAHLFGDAEAGGAAAIEGRVEPNLVEPLRAMNVGLQFAASRALLTARDPEILAALFAGRALLTRLDGEWWAGFHREPFNA